MNCGCENTREIFPECDKTRWEVQCSSYIEDADNYYTKKQVDDLIESATTSGSCCITPEEVDEKIDEAVSGKQDTLIAGDNIIISGNIISAEVPSLSGYATEQWVEDKHYITSVDLSNYYTKDEVNASQLVQDNNIDAISGDVQTLSGKVDTISGDVITLSGDVQTLSGDVQTISGDIITSGDVQTQIDNSISGKADKTEIYTYVGTDRIKVTNTTGTRRKAIDLNLPIYSGNGMTSLSLGAQISTAQGGNQINGSLSTGIGWGLNTKNPSEVATGQFNISHIATNNFGDSGNTLFSVGNGIHQGDEHNALEIHQNGDIYISSGGTASSPMIKLQDHLGGGGGTTYTAGRAINIDSGNTISLDLPISAGTGTNSIKENMSGNVASGSYSHSEGFNTFARGNYSHAEGQGTTAKGYSSHAEGSNTNAYNDFEHASGQYNVSSSGSSTFGDSGNTLFSVGNGTSNSARHNAFEIRQNGDIYITSGGTDIKLQDHIGGGTATTYTAGDNITISNQNVISTITKFWCGDETAYNQIAIKDPNTIYLIHS